MTRATAFAPATVGNVAVGFDVLGHALEAVGDRVTLARIDEPRVRIVAVEGAVLPTDPVANTATAGLLRLIEDRALPFGFEVTIEKEIPLGSGMGGSAASAAAAVVAASALLEAPLSTAEALAYALVGEAVASGAAHADNLAPCLMGGLVLVRATDPPDLVRVPVPEAIRCVLVHPHLRVDTRDARVVLPREIPLRAHVEQSARLAGFLAGCFSGDLALIGRSLSDGLVEPHRARLVPGFARVKAAALAGGALGCSLSGSGPSLFAWCADDATAGEVRAAMVAAFSAEGVASDTWVSPVAAARGARLVEVA